MSLEGYQTRIDSGNRLLGVITEKFSNISGINKLKNKIKQEINFLKKSVESGLLKKEHILCSNLHHYESLVQYLLQCKDCTSVLEVFQYVNEYGEKKRLCVDVVSDQKKKWTKVIARNPKALSLISNGEGEFGQKSVLDQADEYVECANQNLSFYAPPQVEFYFASGIEQELAVMLSEAGVVVGGYLVRKNSDEINDRMLAPVCIGDQKEITDPNARRRLNLDVSTMIAYTSALTNGHSHIPLKGPVLTQQAIRERESPVRPYLDKVFEDADLYCCELAEQSFKTILSTLGGQGEKERGAALLSRVTVVENHLVEGLVPVGQVKERSLAVFGTGLALKAITVTANAGFVRAAANQGIDIPVIMHESRALTEQKEIHQLN